MRTHRDIFEPLVLNQEDCSFDVYCTKQSLDSCYMTNSIIIALAIYLKVIIYVYRQAYKDVKKPDIYKDDIHGVSKNTTNYPVTRRILNHEIECFQITPNDLVSGQPLLIYSIQSPASIGYEHYQLLDVIAPEILVSETIQAYDVIDGRDVAVRVSVIPSAPSPAPISIAFALPDIVSPLDLMDVDVVEQVFSFLIKVIEEEESIPEINLPSWCMLLNNNYSRNQSLIELAELISEYSNVTILRRLIRNVDQRKISDLDKDECSRTAARLVYDGFIDERNGLVNRFGKPIFDAIQVLFEKKNTEKAEKEALKEAKKVSREELRRKKGSDMVVLTDKQMTKEAKRAAAVEKKLQKNADDALKRKKPEVSSGCDSEQVPNQKQSQIKPSNVALQKKQKVDAVLDAETVKVFFVLM